MWAPHALSGGPAGLVGPMTSPRVLALTEAHVFASTRPPGLSRPDSLTRWPQNSVPPGQNLMLQSLQRVGSGTPLCSTTSGIFYWSKHMTGVKARGEIHSTSLGRGCKSPWPRFSTSYNSTPHCLVTTAWAHSPVPMVGGSRLSFCT